MSVANRSSLKWMLLSCFCTVELKISQEGTKSSIKILIQNSCSKMNLIRVRFCWSTTNKICSVTYHSLGENNYKRLFQEYRDHLIKMLSSRQVRPGGNEIFINSWGIMGYTFEKWSRAKEEKLCIFSAWCFGDYEICLLKGPASLVQQSWHAAANTLWLLQSDPLQGCFKRLTLPTLTRFKIAVNTSPYPPVPLKKIIYLKEIISVVKNEFCWQNLMSFGVFVSPTWQPVFN